LLDYNDLLVAVKQACAGTMGTMQLSTFEFGTVISASPLKIQAEQKKTLTKAQLVLTRNVTDFETEVTIDWKTEEKGMSTGDSFSYQNHLHDVKGKKKILIHNALKTGDKVILMKQQGGQKYLVIDRVVNA
jgi:hypothetical protein